MSSHIIRSEATVEYRGNPTSRLLGATFLEAYHALNNDNELLASISRSVQTSTASGATENISAELWALLTNDDVPVHDRPLVEALVRSIDRGVKRAAGR